MAYQVLARKWRPRNFAQLVGQEHVIRALANAFANGRLHHAYLLTGTRGVGKTTIARIMAKALNCEAGVSAEPCGVCSACTQIDAGRFVDLLEIDAASNTGIDNIREVLDNAQYAPTAGRFKVYIIDEVHMLSKSAFNAMLKTLEEPPGHVKFILATTDPQKMPITVLSRCLQFSLRQMTPQQVATHLQNVLQAEAIPYETGALPVLGHAANGSMRDALSLLDQAIAYGAGQVEEAGVRAMLGAVDQGYLFDILAALLEQDGPRLMTAANGIATRGLSYDAALHELAHVLHQIALAQAVPDALAEDLPHHAQIAALAAAFAPEDIQLYYQIALHGRRDLPLAPDEYAGFTMALLRMLAFAPAEPGQLPAMPAKTDRPPVSPAVQRPPSVARPMAETTPVTATPPAAAAMPAPALVTPEPHHEPLAPWEDEAIDAAVATLDLVIDTAIDMPIPAPAPIVPATESGPQPPSPFDGDWRALVAQLKLGAAGMLAQHAELVEFSETHFALRVSDEHRAVAGREYQDKLRGALGEYFGREIRLHVELGEAVGDTPAALALREKHARQLAAESVIQNDTFVQTLIRDFGATVLPDSIRPL
ncbi:DNA polymerase III subunit gamma/tau [Chitiniphilus purpureus]|uniref:DNA polymerase III subunit gamma/tau n=1 Tax=Chitiniphilus purpureus TaxID=2981137 RepID=A0ABY6DRX0_9NEIS|nr:DNA polymerase III subunit gamma/tau [Chitiniphilus sp. CD1]UXY14653.1 DNA polymerase III subunit gamma/tau [Chitiniphilus sp. CD1]